MKNLLVLFTICTFVFSCNTSNKTTAEVTDTTSPENIPVADQIDTSISELDDNPVFYLHRESCRGPCPGYTYTIYQSGKVDYLGQRNVDRVGNFIATMDNAKLMMLTKSADNIKCKKMENEYLDNNIADVPRWTFKYEDKNIKFMEFKAPDNLRSLCKSMDEALDTLEWEKID